MTEKVTFIGMGLMGVPMACRLVDAGYTVVAWNRTFSKVRPLIAKGAFTADTLPKAIESSSVILCMLSNKDAIDAVVAGDVESKLSPSLSSTSLLTQQILQQDKNSKSSTGDAASANISSAVRWKGRTLINLSTIGIQQSATLAAQMSSLGATYMECPVIGTIPHATAGRLIVLCGCDNSELFTKYKALLSVFGEPRYTGGYGTASTMKLAINQIIISQTAALAYSVGLVERSGLSTEDFMSILRGHTSHCGYFDFKYKGMAERSYQPPNFTTELMLKDVRLMMQEGQSKHLDVSAVKGIESLLISANDMGFAEQDFGSIYQAVNPSPTASSSASTAPSSSSTAVRTSPSHAPHPTLSPSSSGRISNSGLSASASGTTVATATTSTMPRSNSAFMISSNPGAADTMLILPGQRSPPLHPSGGSFPNSAMSISGGSGSSGGGSNLLSVDTSPMARGGTGMVISGVPLSLDDTSPRNPPVSSSRKN